MSYKTDNQIFIDLKSVLDSFLASVALSGQTGWKVIQGDQPIPVGINDKMIVVSRIYSTRIGWQGSTDKDIDNNFTHIETWREEVRLQLSFFCQRHPETDTAATWTAEDMAKRTLAYLNSESGIRALLAKGFQRLRRETIRNGAFVNDSEAYQINPSFDLVLLHEQSIQNEAIWARMGDVEAVGI